MGATPCRFESDLPQSSRSRALRANSATVAGWSDEEPPDHWHANVPLRELTTWRIGGPAAFVSQPADLEQIRADLQAARERELPLLALGGGSNLLAADEGYPGLLLRMPPLPPHFLTRDGQSLVRLAAGSSLAEVSRQLAEVGWGGLEWAAGIPGTVAGAVVNNAGAFDGSIAAVLTGARLLKESGRRCSWPAESSRSPIATRVSRARIRPATYCSMSTSRSRRCRHRRRSR